MRNQKEKDRKSQYIESIKQDTEVCLYKKKSIQNPK